MAGMRYGGIMPTESIHIMEQLSRVGGLGRRQESDFKQFGREIAAAIADKTKIQSLPNLMESLIGITQLSEGYLADMTTEQRQGIMAMGRWAAESPTAALRGTLGVQNIGKMMQWTAKTEDPGNQMLIWSMLSRSPSIRQQIGLGPTEPMGMYEFWKARHKPESYMHVMAGISKSLPKQYAEMVLGQQMGFAPEVAEKLVGYFQGAAIPDFNKVKKMIQEGADLPGGAEGEAEKVRKRLADMEAKRVEVGAQFLDKVQKLELTMLSKMEEVLKAPQFDAAVDKFFISVTRFVEGTAGILGAENPTEAAANLAYKAGGGKEGYFHYGEELVDLLDWLHIMRRGPKAPDVKPVSKVQKGK
jgi:hypothetical protein